MNDAIRMTRSVCPICMRNIEASLVRDEAGTIYMEKACEEHGAFRVPVWRGKMDFESWVGCCTPDLAGDLGKGCPQNCGICSEHERGSCCVLLEVTDRCNLNCKFCFANGGTGEADTRNASGAQEENKARISELPLDKLKSNIQDIVSQCKEPLLQLSGGEPTLRDDLPELVKFAKKAGCSYVQINTNGIRLATDEAYVKALAEAGTDIIFLQFDGTKDEIYEKLRGKALLEIKKKAIENCSKERMGVTLVPTIVSGVNDQNIGDLIRFAANQIPGVRGIHFQPVSYFGRYPDNPLGEERYTLDQLMADISSQAGIDMKSFKPSCCDHPLCGFHSDYLVEPSGKLRSLSSASHSAKEQGCCAKDNREYVARHWRRPPEEIEPEHLFEEEMDLDTFLYCFNHRSLTLSAMAFQDAGNLNIERLHRCSLHVYNHGKIIPFCANYLTPIKRSV